MYAFRFVARLNLLCGHAVLDDLTIKQVHGAIRVLREPLIMSDHANRGATLMQFAQQLHHRFAIPRIEIASRLIGKQNRRPAGKRARDGDTLLLTTGELTREMFASMRHAYPLKSFRHQRFAVAGAHAAIGERQFHILKNAKVSD
jgi:hypothetical protein